MIRTSVALTREQFDAINAWSASQGGLTRAAAIRAVLDAGLKTTAAAAHGDEMKAVELDIKRLKLAADRAKAAADSGEMIPAEEAGAAYRAMAMAMARELATVAGRMTPRLATVGGISRDDARRLWEEAVLDVRSGLRDLPVPGWAGDA